MTEMDDANLKARLARIEKAKKEAELYARLAREDEARREAWKRASRARSEELVRMIQDGGRNILIVEDNAEHLEDVRGVFARRDQSALAIDTKYVSTLDDALREIETGRYHGIMSDVFFPDISGGKEELNGTKVAQAAFDRGLPVILVTSTYHHSTRTGPACIYARNHNFELIDTWTLADILANQEELNKEDRYVSRKKNFRGALWALGYAVDARDELDISSNGYGRSEKPYGHLLDVKSVIYLATHIEEFKNKGTLRETFEEHFANNPLLEVVAQRYCGGLFPELSE